MITSVTLHLPEVVMQRARYTASAVQQPLEEVLTAILAATLPDMDDVPSDMRAELARIAWLSEQELWTIARSAMTGEQQEQFRHLTSLQAQQPLTQEEQTNLELLRQEYGRVTLRKARAFALLSLRGGQSLYNVYGAKDDYS